MADREQIVLLHALGLTRRSWDPVRARLAEHFDVHALDLPGFGAAAPLPDAAVPTPAAIAESVAASLDARGIERPHVVGNSIGGWVALELAALRPLASLTLLAPAGLWPGATPRYCRISLRTTRWLTVHLPRVLHLLVRTRIGRTLVLAQSHGRPWRMSPGQAHTSVEAMRTGRAFDAVLDATLGIHYTPSAPLDVPTTVAYGTRDRILPRRSWRDTDRLPSGTTVATLPGCGHIPMPDDPAAVADLIVRATSIRESSARLASR